jgi:formylglycine-generating enzyme required for sulfatase activity
VSPKTISAHLSSLFILAALLVAVRPVAAQPAIGIARAGPQTILFWPATTSGTNGVLQSSTSLASPSWVTATDAAPANYAPYTAVSVTNSSSPRFFRLSLVPPTADGMALIPAGPFTMGDALDGETDAVPTNIYVSAFYMDTNLVSYSQWQGVYAYATSLGYDFDHAGSGKADNHPVQTVDWYDAVKWCNARSQQAGLTPCYYTDSGLTVVYQSGQVAPYVNWGANGYRLPTEAEWEKAARGGLSGQRFPWGLTISESQANYLSNTNFYAYDLGPSGYNATFNDGVMPYTSPVGYFAANGYGLYDMADNVTEWCWDWYGTTYGQPSANNPTGPASGTSCVLRGGEWAFTAYACRCAYRFGSDPSSNYSPNLGAVGFRCVRGPWILLMKTTLSSLFTVAAVLLAVRPATAQPTLGIAGAGPQAILFWPATTSGTNGVLQTSTTLTSPSWVTATDAFPVNYLPYIAVSVTNSSAARFFRLSLVPPAADGMALVPAGPFTMGDTLDGGTYEVPTNIYVSAFYMDTNVVSYSQWQGVYAYATNQGYAFDHPGSRKEDNHPVWWVDWWDTVKWCNARSQQTGLTPCYYTDSGLTVVYQTGQVTNPYVNWSANGYRLPTEAEWEKAARGGLSGQRFPWGLTISESQANYTACTNCGMSYDLGPYDGRNTNFDDGVFPYTSPVDYFAPNGYGLDDMAGNVWQWCWDWAGTTYGQPSATDPTGPASGSERMFRGGSWINQALISRCAARHPREPTAVDSSFGFRCVRRQ